MSRTRKTLAEVKDQVDQLLILRDKIPARNFFGESNRDRIDAAIEVLDKRLDNDDIFDKWGEDAEDANDTILIEALDVLQWVNGYDVDSPAENWKSLAEEMEGK